MLTLLFAVFTEAFAMTPSATPCDLHMLGHPDPQVSEWIARVKNSGATDSALANYQDRFDSSLKQILAIPSPQRTFENTILAADSALDLLASEGVALETLALLNVNPERDQEAARFQDAFKSRMARFAADADLFRAIRQTAAARGVETELKMALLRRLHEGGADLASEKRREVQRLTTEANALSLKFAQTLTANTSTLELRSDELLGVNHEFVAEHSEAGVFKLPLRDPQLVRTVLTEARREDVRRRVYFAYRNRNPENLQTLSDFTRKLREISAALGKPSWFEHVVNDRALSGGPRQTRELLEQLRLKDQPKIEQRRREMQELKAKDSSQPLQIWDLFYYENRVLQRQASAALEAPAEKDVSEYFTAARFLPSFLNFVERMYALKFTPVLEASQWDKSVQLFAVDDVSAGRRLGFVYLDLYSRPGKDPSSAFVEQLVPRRHAGGVERLPVLVLSVNWGPYAQREHMSISLDDASTTLHEMGHALHNLFQGSSYYATSGWMHPTDFMEVPSTSFDLLINEPEVLRELSSHRDDPAKKMPLEMAQQVAKGEAGYQMVGGDRFSPSHNHDVIMLATFDAELQAHEGDLRNPENLAALYRLVFQRHFGVDPTGEDGFPQSFHHISSTEYAGNYSSYLWASLVSENVVRRWKELGGVTNPVAFQTWRRMVLEVPQYERPVSAVIEEFLGHPLRVQ